MFYKLMNKLFVRMKVILRQNLEMKKHVLNNRKLLNKYFYFYMFTNLLSKYKPATV